MKTFTLWMAVLVGCALNLRAQPMFLYEPQGQIVSEGANVLFQALAIGPGPVEYQWLKNETPMIGATADFLFLPRATAADAGEYRVVARLDSGSITSVVAVLGVDSTFVKIVDGELVNRGGSSSASAWGDYDNDGDQDVFVARAGTAFNELYRNEGNGQFSRITNGPVVSELAITISGSWADFDNDGWLDLFLANNGPSFNNPGTNVLYRNNGDGTFTRTTGILPAEGNNSNTSAWGDYDRDGYLDLTVGNTFNANLLYRNTGGDRLVRPPSSVFPADSGKLTYGAAWIDYNNDGDLDLAFSNGGFGPNEMLYENRAGRFVRETNSPAVTAGGNSISTAFADYDNDGDLDWFVANAGGQNNFLFRNENGSNFLAITGGDIANDGGDSQGAAWGDYDNDGWLDLFVANNSGQEHFLYHNRGDGTFVRVDVGSPIHDGGSATSCAWVDVDNDGFLDLFVSNVSTDNALYRNRGNTNAWLKVRCVGDASNKWGVGARVRVRATIAGVSRWLTREIAARDGFGSPNTLLAEFGLGDALRAELVRIEWPSGIVQEIADVATRQVLTAMEPPSLNLLSATLSEGDTGMQALQFNLRLTQPTNVAVTVEFHTVDGTATAGLDYHATNGTLTIEAGQTNVAIAVPVLGDLLDETNEFFLLIVSNATVVPIVVAQAMGTILDDDPLALTVNDTNVVEGDAGLQELIFTLQLNKTVDYPVSVDFGTVNAFATGGQDYLATNGTIIVPAGSRQQTLAVQILGDLLDEQNENFFINLSNGVDVTIADRQGNATIIDNDPLPILTVHPVQVLEGNGSTNHAVFLFELSAPSGRSASVNFATTNGTAIAPADYFGKSGSVSFAPGATTRTVFVVVNGDLVLEGNETFLLQLTMPSNLELRAVNAAGLIRDDDFRAGTPGFSMDGLTLSFPSVSGRNLRVEWSDSLAPDAVWTPLTGAETLPGTGNLMQVTDPLTAGVPQRFYRIQLLP